MKIHLQLSLILLWIGLVSSYYGDYPEVYNLNPGNERKSYRQYAAEVREATRMLSGHADATQQRHEYERIREEAFSVNIKDGFPEEYSGNLTAACSADWQEYVAALTSPLSPLWALRMFDSTGLLDPGLLDGNLLFEGRYDECRRASYRHYSEPEFPVIGLYCVAWWPQSVFSGRSRGKGICIPDTCTDEDAEALIRTVFNPGLPADTKVSVRCERGKPELADDPQAIITIIIYSLFGFLVIVATVYHHFLVQTEADQSGPGTQITSKRQTDKVKPTQYENEVTSPNGIISGNQQPQGDEPTLISVKQSNGQVNGGFATDDKGAMEMRTSGVTDVTDASGHTAVPVQDHSEPLKDNKKSLDELNKVEQLLLAFSMYITMPLITTTKQARSAIGCLNGIRFLAFCAVILGHTYALGTVGTPATIENEYVMFMTFLTPKYYKLVTMDVYVDTFFIISAFLVAIGFLRKLDKTGGNLGVSGWVMHYFGRWWRLTGTYFVVLLFFSNMKEYLAAGPFMADLSNWNCQEHWWANLLYINNFYSTCMGHAWYLAVDMQMFIIAPLFLYVLWRWPKAGVVFNVLGLCGGVVATGVLKHEVYTQTAEPGDEDYVDDFVDIYVKPWCRCPVYFMGLLLGYFFYRTGGKVTMPWWLVSVGWLVATTMWVLVSYLPALTVCTDLAACGEWTAAGSTAYYTFNRLMWGVWVCWLILACATGYGGFVNTFLSWKFFVPLGKLTYLGYLIHPIFTYGYFFGSPIQQYYYDYFFFYLFFANMLIVHLCSLVLAFSVSAPLMGIMGVFLPSMRGKARR